MPIHQDYDWLVWLDIDTLIMNITYTLEDRFQLSDGENGSFQAFVAGRAIAPGLKLPSAAACAAPVMLAHVARGCTAKCFPTQTHWQYMIQASARQETGMG